MPSAQMPSTTAPSDLRTPPQLTRGSCSHTPRASKARMRDTRRRGRFGCRAARAAFGHCAQRLLAKHHDFARAELAGVVAQLLDLGLAQALDALARPFIALTAAENLLGTLHGLA